MTDLDVSVVLPCLNESATIRACVEKALRSFEAGKSIALLERIGDDPRLRGEGAAIF
ncbi:MAG: hypothetical protein HZC38_05990 [Chloroflexi bacterium]|nr:hypothetical protein [Chloroflexota bacterium]